MIKILKQKNYKVKYLKVIKIIFNNIIIKIFNKI